MSRQPKKHTKKRQFNGHKGLPEVAASSKPTSVNKTGVWRSLTPVINYDKCTSCMICWKYCPDLCIEIEAGGTPKIIPEYCKGCGICAQECPTGAIKME